MNRILTRLLILVVVLTAVALIFNIALLLWHRHQEANRCRAAGYTWIGAYSNMCIDAPEVHP